MKTIIGVVGMPGSGKSIVDDVAQEMGFSIIIMGDVIREEVAKRGFAPTPENVGKVMVEIRKEEGPAIVALRCIPKIQSLSNKQVIVEGIRSFTEAYEFRQSFPSFKLLAIHASPKVRFSRIFRRNRSDDSTDWQIFAERDLRETEVGVGSAIALADYMIVNESSIPNFKTEIRKYLRVLLSE